MSMVDENDPYKGLKTSKRRFGFPKWFRQRWLFALMVVLTVIAGVREEYDQMYFGVLVLFLLLVVDYLHDIRKEMRALRLEVNAHQYSLTQVWHDVPQQTVDLLTGRNNKRQDDKE